MKVNKNEWLRLPVVSAGSEYLVMGYLMRRNILTYKAPQGNEGYDLICIHPDPRHKLKNNQQAQIRVQVKSRYAADCNWSFLLKENSLEAFDFLIVAFLNIGQFYRGNDGTSGSREPEFYTLPRDFIRQHLNKRTSWQKVELKPIRDQIDKYKNEKGFELIAKALGIPHPKRKSTVNKKSA